MNDHILNQYSDYVEEEIVEKYLAYEEKIKSVAKLSALRYFKIAVAVCAFVIISSIAFWGLLNSFVVKDGEERYFTLNAYATNGELSELDMIEGTFSSGIIDENIFGVDFPLFNFFITLSDENGDKITFSDVDIFVSYNGSDDVSAAKDEHVMVFYVFPVQGSNKPAGYCVSGWFEDPTDITVKIKDKETGETLESYILNVCYLSESEEYLLKVMEIKTNYR